MHMIEHFGESRAFLCEIEKTNRKKRLKGREMSRTRTVSERHEGVSGITERSTTAGRRPVLRVHGLVWQ